ncbi:hypothetical protein SXCC_03984 [Gluconacetobacter sp. SXCC-1]|nr:hypothetical protein SXCC_03984 [Gluconacetobacter sp. SXCC-1]
MKLFSKSFEACCLCEIKAALKTFIFLYQGIILTRHNTI